MIYKDTPENKLFICKLSGSTAGFREGRSAAEVLEMYPDVLEAYPLTEGQERELVAAWHGYFDNSREAGSEPRARELLAAIVRNIYQRAKEGASV